MEVFRRLERRLEALLDGAVAGVFRGPLHPTELAGRLAREADLASESTEWGTRVPNHYRVTVSPHDLEGTTPPGRLMRWLADGLEELALERGWRMDGPAIVELTADDDTPRGAPHCIPSHRPGPRRAWAVLHGDSDVAVTVNHAVVGRSDDVDVEIGDDTVSRSHARLWTEGGHIMVRDLASSNGTWVDGVAVGDGPVEVPDTSRLTFGGASFIVRRR